MFRFSIRELLLVTLVAALSVAWRLDHSGWLSATVKENRDLKWKVEALEHSLRFVGYQIKYDEEFLIVDGDKLSYGYGGRYTGTLILSD